MKINLLLVCNHFHQATFDVHFAPQLCQFPIANNDDFKFPVGVCWLVQEWVQQRRQPLCQVMHPSCIFHCNQCHFCLYAVYVHLQTTLTSEKAVRVLLFNITKKRDPKLLMQALLVSVWVGVCMWEKQMENALLRPFSIWFSICLPPVHPAVIGYLAFAGVQIQGLFSWNSNGPGGTSGAHTTCCEERPVLLRVPSPAPGALLARLTVPA